MSLRSAIVTAFFWVCVVPMAFLTIFSVSSVFHPMSNRFLFDVAHSSFIEFNFTATTNIEGTNNFHYRYNLSLNITIHKPDKNYDFMHYDDVKVMALYKNKKFAMVDLSSFYRGKELANTTDLLSLTHTLIGEYDVLAIDSPPVDGQNLFDGHRGVDAITDDYMLAQLYYSMSPPRNTTWPDKTIYSKEELEFKCELELKFPLINGQYAQRINTSTPGYYIDCKASYLAVSCKHYFYHCLIFLVGFCIALVLLGFDYYLQHCDDQADDDPTIHDNIPLKQPLLHG